MNHERRQQRIRSAATAIEHTRRARIAPLLAAGMSVRAIAAETGIPVGAVHQLEKGVAQGRQNATAIAQQLPTSYAVKQNVGGIPHDGRRNRFGVRAGCGERNRTRPFGTEQSE
jgi:hypothetical protein